MYIRLQLQYLLFLLDFNETNFLERFLIKTHTPNFMKIRRAGSELLHVDGRTDRHDEANSRYSQLCGRA